MRGAAAGALLGLGVVVLRGASSPARISAALFAAAAASHTLTQMPGASLEHALGVLWPLIWAFSIMGAGLFWLFAGELFDDRPRLEAWRFAPAILLLAVGIAGANAPLGIASTIWLVHNLIGAAFTAHALVTIIAGWRGDLVEARRRLRGPILAAGGAYALVVLSVQTGELLFGSAEAASPLAAFALMILAFVSLGAFARADFGLFGTPDIAKADTGTAEIAPSRDIDRKDVAIAEALDRLMRDEKIYREDGLTITKLASKLRIPEHRLRRIINQGLGHRNFSAYVNEWRLADAKAALGDPVQREVPVSTIALDAGFASLGPFNRAFKTETGLTPSEYRARTLVNKA